MPVAECKDDVPGLYVTKVDAERPCGAEPAAYEFLVFIQVFLRVVVGRVIAVDDVKFFLHFSTDAGKEIVQIARRRDTLQFPSVPLEEDGIGEQFLQRRVVAHDGILQLAGNRGHGVVRIRVVFSANRLYQAGHRVEVEKHGSGF